MCFRPHTKVPEDLVLLLDNLVFQGLSSPIISCLLFTTVTSSTAYSLKCTTPYCLQRDLASSVKHNARKQIPQCLVSFRDQHHTQLCLLALWHHSNLTSSFGFLRTLYSFRHKAIQRAHTLQIFTKALQPMFCLSAVGKLCSINLFSLY